MKSCTREMTLNLKQHEFSTLVTLFVSRIDFYHSFLQCYQLSQLSKLNWLHLWTVGTFWTLFNHSTKGLSNPDRPSCFFLYAIKRPQTALSLYVCAAHFMWLPKFSHTLGLESMTSCVSGKLLLPTLIFLSEGQSFLVSSKGIALSESEFFRG